MHFNLCGTADQRDVVTESRRFLGLFAGRRWGKSFAIANRIIYRCLSRKGMRYWYIAPTYGQAFEQYERIANNSSLSRAIRTTRLQPYPRITFHNGSEASFRTFERPKNLRGSGLHEVAIDEIQDVGRDYFWPVIRPLVSDKRGTILVAGQFRGKNWYHKEFFEKGQTASKVSRSWRFPSSTGLVYQSQAGRDELELARQQIPRAIFEQEYECIPMANQSAVFRYDDLERAKRGRVLDRGVGAGSYVVGLDLGRVADPSSLVVLDAKGSEVVYSEIRPLGERHELGAQHAARVVRDFGECPCVVDVTGGATGGRQKHDAYTTHYRDQIPTMRSYTWNYENKRRIIENLMLAVEQDAVSIPEDHTELHEQLSAYEYSLAKSGRVDYHAPTGEHDDLVAALAMAWEGKRRGWYGGARAGASSLGAVLG